jgi:hypothetical protein
MALPLLNNAESQASGTTVTTGNSGGIDANAFGEVVIGANMTATFDSGVAAHGANGFKLALTSTATAITYVGWTATEVGGAVVTLYGAVYFRIHSAVASSVRWLDFRNGAALVARLGLVNGTASQGVQWRTAADASSGTISGTLAADTLYRCEFQVAANGSAIARVFTGDGTTQLGVDAVPAANYLGTTFDGFRAGFNTANFSSTSGEYIAIDSINLNAVGMPGPGPYTVGLRPDYRKFPKPRLQRTVA